MGKARQFLQLPGVFEMHRGGSISSPTIAYETWGELNDKHDNAVLIFTGLSPSAHATASPVDPSPGWWEEMVGPHRPIDTHHYFVICINSLGVVDYFAIKLLYALVGPSMGGMTALAFAAQFPRTSRNLVLLSTAARSLPYSIALRSLQREMIRRDPDWKNGLYEPGSGPIGGMRLARKLGMISYRSGKEWKQRFGRERISGEERSAGDSFAMDFEVEAYLEHHAQKFIGEFDANCYLYLSRASDLFDLAEHGGSIEAALKRVQAESVLIIGVESDGLFPIEQQRELAAEFAAVGKLVRLVELASIQGHDSFLADMDGFRPVIGDFFAAG
jgi:homoserine O-acetyltransferase